MLRMVRDVIGVTLILLGGKIMTRQGKEEIARNLLAEAIKNGAIFTKPRPSSNGAPRIGTVKYKGKA